MEQNLLNPLEDPKKDVSSFLKLLGVTSDLDFFNLHSFVAIILQINDWWDIAIELSGAQLFYKVIQGVCRAEVIVTMERIFDSRTERDGRSEVKSGVIAI